MTLTLDARGRLIPDRVDRAHQPRKADQPLRTAELQLLHHRRPDEPPDAHGEPRPTFPNRPWRNLIQESFEVAALLHLLAFHAAGGCSRSAAGAGSASCRSPDTGSRRS